MAIKDEQYGWLAVSQVREKEIFLNQGKCERRSIMFLFKLFSFGTLFTLVFVLDCYYIFFSLITVRPTKIGVSVAFKMTLKYVSRV